MSVSYRESVKKNAPLTREAIELGMDDARTAKFVAANAQGDQQLVETIWQDMCESPNLYSSTVPIATPTY